MKKLLCLIIWLLVCSPAWGASLIGSGVTAAGGSCDAAVNEVGWRGTGNDNIYTPADFARVYYATADCSGELDTAYFYDDNATAAEVKVCIYNDDGDGYPNDSGDTLVACTTVEPDGTVGLFSTAVTAGNNVTQGNGYFVAVFNSTTATVRPWRDNTQATETTWYKVASGFYASPPANLGAASLSTSTNYQIWKAYVTIK